MVHHDKKYDSIAEAGKVKNGVAVVGILFHVANDPNPIMEQILKNAGQVFEAAGKNQTFKDTLLLEELLPRNKANFFRYEGSLTTPGCGELIAGKFSRSFLTSNYRQTGEAVIWTVFENSVPISLDQVERFKSVQDDTGEELKHNYRHIQPLNSRALVYVQGSLSDENNAAVVAQAPVAMLILSSIAMLMFHINF